MVALSSNSRQTAGVWARIKQNYSRKQPERNRTKVSVTRATSPLSFITARRRLNGYRCV